MGKGRPRPTSLYGYTGAAIIVIGISIPIPTGQGAGNDNLQGNPIYNLTLLFPYTNQFFQLRFDDDKPLYPIVKESVVQKKICNL